MLFVTTFLILLPANAHALIGSFDWPELIAVWSEPAPLANLDHVFVMVDIPKNFDRSVARRIILETRDAGTTFIQVDAAEIPSHFVKLPDSEKPEIKRRLQGYFAAERISNYLSTYGHRLPAKSHYWNAAYLGISLLYLGIIVRFLVKKRFRTVVTSLTKSALHLSLIAIALNWVAASREILIDILSPPSISLGLLMYVATQPVALVLAFCVFIIFLPSTIDLFLFDAIREKPTENWQFNLWRGCSTVFWLSSMIYIFVTPVLHLI